MPPKSAKRKKSKFWQEGSLDIKFLSLVLILLTIGLVMLFSASYAYSYQYYGNSYKFIIRQSLFAVAGVVVMLIVSKVNYHIWQKLCWPIFIVTLLLLGVLLILPPMVSGMDVKRWIVIGPANFQPSELAKFAIIVLLSNLIAVNPKLMKSWRFLAFLAGIIGVTCVLVVLEPHISATILIFAISIVLLIVGGLQKRYIIGGGAAGVGLILTAIFTGFIGYGSDRIKYWRDPWLDPKDKGYQVIQSLLAIGSGGVLGRGIGQSRQKYLWVPEPHNDFIFAIVCEELGLVGAIIIILLFAMLVYRGFTVAMRASDRFGSLLAVGLTFQVGLQAMLNIWVVTNTMPNTGISLPFFSYGGTSLLLLLFEMGIVLSVSRGANISKA